MDDGISVDDFEPPDDESAGDGPFDPEFPGSTPDAPYGFTQAGKPRKRRPNGSGTGKTGGKRPGRRKRSTVNYAGIVHDLIMSVATPLVTIGAATGNKTLLADGWLLGDRAEPVATAMGEIAQQEERIARALEKIAEVTPYAALTAAIMPAIPQLLVNHGVLKPGVMNTIDPDDIAATFMRTQPAPAEPSFDYDLPSEEMGGNGAQVPG